METFKKNLLKIEQPLSFAAKDNFRNLAHIRELGKSLSALATSVISLIPPAAKNIFEPPLDNIARIFSDYDTSSDELKKEKINEATRIIGRLIMAADNFEANQPIRAQQLQQINERIDDLKDSAEKLALPVRFIKGVGPKMSDRFAAKKINTVEDLLYFLPRTYEDRREIKNINKLETGKIQTIIAEVVTAEFRYYGRRRILEVSVRDQTGVSGQVVQRPDVLFYTYI